MATYSRSKSWSVPGPYGVVYKYSRRDWKIEKPFIRPLVNHPYSFYSAQWVSIASNKGMQPPGMNGINRALTGTRGTTECILARNKALTKLQSTYGESAMALVNALERKQAYNMVLNRSLQLIGAVKALKTGNLKLFAKSLGVSSKQLERARKGRAVVISSKGMKTKVRSGSFKQRSKDVSATWLEYHFGWEPLIKDIHTGIEIMQNPYEPKQLVTRARGNRTEVDPNRSWTNRWCADWTMSYGWRLSAKLSVQNPNLFRATQLGLVNPAAVAWELVPFSFVVDWFLPVGEFLNSYSNLFGVSVSEPLQTCFEQQTFQYSTWWSGSNQWGSFGGVSVIVWRDTSLPTYSLRLKQFKGFSVARGATAIALLIQQLKAH